METPQEKKTPQRKIVYVVAAVLLLSVAATAAYGATQHLSVVALQRTVLEQKQAIDAASTKASEQAAAFVDAQKRASSAGQAAAAESSGYKSSIEAFALQAASCERVKQQLKVLE
jgi:hypothetical protein